MSLLNIIKNLGFYKKIDLDEEKFEKLLDILDEKDVTYKVLYENNSLEGIRIYKNMNYNELSNLIKQLKESK